MLDVHMMISIPQKYAISGGPTQLGPRQRPRQPLRAAQFIKPPALPGDTYFACPGKRLKLLLATRALIHSINIQIGQFSLPL
jgi:hypothetical protein